MGATPAGRALSNDPVWAALSLASGFLSRVFLMEPEARFLETLRDLNPLRDWPVPCPRPETVRGLKEMSGVLDALSRESLEELRRDFTRLFIGPGEAAAPPYESFYLGGNGLLFDEVTLNVRYVYREYSLRAPRKNREPDDHIGLELALVSELAGRQSQLDPRRVDDTHQTVSGLSSFLSRHLLRWSEEFLDRMLAAARTDFYRGAARMTRGTLAEMASAAGL